MARAREEWRTEKKLTFPFSRVGLSPLLPWGTQALHETAFMSLSLSHNDVSSSDTDGEKLSCAMQANGGSRTFCLHNHNEYEPGKKTLVDFLTGLLCVSNNATIDYVTTIVHASWFICPRIVHAWSCRSAKTVELLTGNQGKTWRDHNNPDKSCQNMRITLQVTPTSRLMRR